MKKSYRERWEIIGDLGTGGQGVVSEVLDKNKFDISQIIAALAGLKSFGLHADKTQELHRIKGFRDAVEGVINMKDPKNHGALKVLNPPAIATYPEGAEARFDLAP